MTRPPPPPLTSPWVYEAADYRNKAIRISLAFDEATHAIVEGVVYRDPDCLYTRILIGLGADGAADTTMQRVDVPAGTTTVSRRMLRRIGLDTIDDVLGLQITAS